MTRAPRPIGAGNIAIGASLGGPLFTNLGAPIPTPMASVFGIYGISDKLHVDAGLHLPVVRAAGLDVGLLYSLISAMPAKSLSPSLSIGMRLLLFGNIAAVVGQQNPYTLRSLPVDPRLFEEAYLIAAWDLNRKWLVWSSLSALSQLEDAIVRPALAIGTEYHASPTWTLGTELSWLDFTAYQDNLSVRYLGIQGQGALAIRLGVTYHIQANPANPKSENVP